jgi:hypothetical protein
MKKEIVLHILSRGDVCQSKANILFMYIMSEYRGIDSGLACEIIRVIWVNFPEKVKVFVYTILSDNQWDLVVVLGREFRDIITGVYPGIVTKAVETILAGRRDEGIELWKSWIPRKLAVDDIVGSRVGVKLILDKQPDEVFVRQLIIASDFDLELIALFPDIVIPPVSKIIDYFSEDAFMCAMEPIESIVKQGYTDLIDGLYEWGRSSGSLESCCPGSSDAILDSIFPLARTLRERVIPKIVELGTEPDSFGRLIVSSWIPRRQEANEKRLVEIIRAGNNAALRFAAIRVLPAEKPSVVHRVLFYIIHGLFEGKAMRAVSSEYLDKLGDFRERYTDSVIDSLILNAKSKQQIDKVVWFLIKRNQKIPPSIAIDVVRYILETHTAREMPAVSMRLLGALICQFGNSVDTTTDLLTPQEILCNETIYAIKYVVADHPSIEKSILAISVLLRAIQVFASSQVQIVRLCDVFPIIVEFMQPDDVRGSRDQDDVRLIVGLEMIKVINGLDLQVVDFFYARMNEVWCLIRDRLKLNHQDSTIFARLLSSISIALTTVRTPAKICEDIENLLDRYRIH